MKQDHHLFHKPTDWHTLGHKAVQRICWFASAFLLAYLVWGPK